MSNTKRFLTHHIYFQPPRRNRNAHPDMRRHFAVYRAPLTGDLTPT